MQKCKRCRNKECDALFIPCPQVPDQKYCSRGECQRARKREWNKKKIASDSDYREARKAAQERWRKKNPDYWKQYRACRQEYVRKNRLQQQARNKKCRQGDIAPMIAETDESIMKNNVPTGRYLIIPIRNNTPVKTDESIIEIVVLSTG